ncbi:MAG TPA: FAD-binding protein, partial [Dehalococcoidales bacterium]
TAVNTRTGEFNIFKSKATVIATGGAGRLSFFAPELTASSSMNDLNASGTGHAIAWQAGAELVLMEASGPGRLSGLGYAPYSMGNTHNTYHGVSIVDADRKEVPWSDVFGNPLTSVQDRFGVAPGQPFQLGAGIGIGPYLPQFRSPDLIRDLPERIKKGEFKLPLYADFTLLPEEERRCVFGMMVGNEGKTRIPIYDQFTKAGFDPEEDLLQAPVMVPESYAHSNFWGGQGNPNLRSMGGGGLLVDWDLRTSLEGLYAAGGAPIYGSGCHGESHTTGRYAGRKAAAYAKQAAEPVADRHQLAAEKNRVYALVNNSSNGPGWKELNYAIVRLMQDYAGRYKNETTLKQGLHLLTDLQENEGAAAHAANPHELGRLLECFSLLNVGELILQSSLVRKCCNSNLDFVRLDYPQVDPPEWDKLLPIRQEDGRVKVRDLPLDYHLKAPYAADYEGNYQKHNGA